MTREKERELLIKLLEEKIADLEKLVRTDPQNANVWKDYYKFTYIIKTTKQCKI
jgi:hypothetical protein